MALLRRVIGETLRGQRVRQRRTLRDVSSEARVSLGYLSEVERGQKEASSELLAAICEALGVRLSEVLHEVSELLKQAEAPRRTVPAVPVPNRAPQRELAGVGAARGPAPALPDFGEDGGRDFESLDKLDKLDKVDQVREPAGMRDELETGLDGGRDHHPDFDRPGDDVDELNVDSVVFDAELAAVTGAGVVVAA